MGIDVFQTCKQICACCWLKRGGALDFAVMPLNLLLSFLWQGQQKTKALSSLPSDLGLMTAAPRYLHPSDYMMKEKKKRWPDFQLLGIEGLTKEAN